MLVLPKVTQYSKFTNSQNEFFGLSKFYGLGYVKVPIIHQDNHQIAICAAVPTIP